MHVLVGSCVGQEGDDRGGGKTMRGGAENGQEGTMPNDAFAFHRPVLAAAKKNTPPGSGPCVYQ